MGDRLHTRECAYVTSEGPAPCTCGHWDRVTEELQRDGKWPFATPTPSDPRLRGDTAPGEVPDA